MVTSNRQLDEVLAAVRSAGRMALDTEFLREKTYFARLCLAQVATPDRVYLIDPVKGADASRLAEPLADSDVEVVFHAGWQDLQWFYRRAGCVPTRVFDVQLAAAFAGLGASQSYGRLVEDILGVSLEKGEAYTDWCRRPLTDRQLAYAADDVRYLLPVADALKAKLVTLGRTSWVEEEMHALERADVYAADEEAWKKVTGQGTLSPRQVTILRGLVHWREDAAAQRDLPRGWLIKDATLVEIARRAPSSVAELKTIRGIERREAERSGEGILAAVQRGKDAAVIKRPHPPNKNIQQRARMISGLADALLRARADQASIAPEMVATRSEVDVLLFAVLSGKEASGDDHRLLSGWRRELAGEAIVDLAQGRRALRVVDQPPFVEEMEL